jgi:transcriptional regulator with XRE-family HTH domain
MFILKKTISIGERFKQIRAREHWNRQEMADKIGVHLQTIFNIEKLGIRPSIDTLEKFYKAFDIAPEERMYFNKLATQLNQEKTLSNLLRTIRIKENLTQKDVAALLDASEATINYIENDKVVVSKDFLLKIYKVFNVAPADQIFQYSVKSAKRKKHLKIKKLGTEKIPANLFLKIRQGNNLTQQELADKLGVSHTTIVNVETGKSQGTRTIIKKLAEVFKLGPEDITFTPQNKPKKWSHAAPGTTTTMANIFLKTRLEYQLTLQELADKLGVVPSAIFLIEKEKSFSHSILHKLYETFNTAPENRIYFDKLGQPLKKEIETMADIFIKIRYENDLTLQELADKLGISTSTISLIEKGRSFPNSILYKLYKTFNIAPENRVYFDKQSQPLQKDMPTLQQIAEILGINSAIIEKLGPIKLKLFIEKAVEIANLMAETPE